MVIHIGSEGGEASQWQQEHPFFLDRKDHELRDLGILYKLKAHAEEAAQRGGDVIRAMHDRAGHGIFALMAKADKAFELALLMMLRVRQLEEELAAHPVEGMPSPKLSLQVGMASGKVLDLGGYNAFGDPVNTAFKLGEDVASDWEIAIADSTFEMLELERTAPFGCTRKEASLSKVTIGYHSIDWQCEHIQQRVAGPLMLAMAGALNEDADSADASELAHALRGGSLDIQWSAILPTPSSPALPALRQTLLNGADAPAPS